MEKIEIKKKFVTFYSPGTFVAEQTTKEIDSYDIDKAVEMSNDIKERHGATPYGFQFTTRGRSKDDLDSKIIDTSPMHYINCKILTIDEIESRKDPKDKTLISNMKCNGWKRIVQTIKGWKWSQPLEDNDIVIHNT